MKVKEIFNGDFAFYYEKVINRIASFVQVNRWRRRLVDGALSLKPYPKLVIDYCSGAGNVGEILMRRVFAVKLVNCDISKPLLFMAKDKFDGKCFYICSDNRFFPLKENLADIIFSSFCVRNSPQPEKTIREVGRVLKPNGVWAILEFFKPERRDPLFCINRSILYQFMNLHKFVSESNREAIDYFFESIDNFYTLNQFKKILNLHGFSLKITENFMGGVATNLIAVKGGKDV